MRVGGSGALGARATFLIHLPGRLLHTRPGTRVWVLVGVLALSALALYAIMLMDAPPVAGPFHVEWWYLAPVFLLAESYPVHVHFRRETHSFSMSDFALVLGLFLASPSHLLLAQLVGCAAAVIIVRRQRPLKAVFNIALFSFTTCLAILVFRVFDTGETPYGIVGWAGALAAVGVAAVAGSVLVATAIWLTDSAAHLRELPFVTAVGIASAITSASLGLAALQLVQTDVLAIWVLAVPIAMSAIVFHAYTRQRRRSQHLAFLYTSMRAVQAKPSLHAATRELIQAAQEMVSAEFGELVLMPRSEGERPLRSVIDPRGERLLEPTELTPAAEFAVRFASLSEKVTLLPSRREPHVLDPYLTELGVSDALVSAIRSENGVTGMLLLGDRAGDVTTFTADDRKLLETFANHAGVLLENDQVREQLRHQAFHDELTGLPNRALFTQRVTQALAQPRSTDAPVVLFLDLDDFKTINDSLGHGVGDELLIGVAKRVSECSGSRGGVARLGGDEFGILLPHASLDDARQLGTELLDAFREAIVIDGRELSVRPSIGIAEGGFHASTADELLRNADVAMYSAKDSGKRNVTVYEPEMHMRAKRRQELATALELAVQRHEFRVHYQPIVDFATGDIVAFEALARWDHPDHGLLGPGSFIQLAEETGLMASIGRIVRREASRQLAAWRSKYPGSSLLWISANVSATELQNPHLVEEVSEMLREVSLGSENLVLEITESGALREPDVTIEQLRGLRQLGVRVALDDFGTGYSSLSHLRDLPIDFVKIAKPFVDTLVGSETAKTFVSAIVQIANALNLAVVSEGIEQPEQATVLRTLGCEFAQGYHYSRPLDAEQADAYLRATMQREWKTATERRASHAGSNDGTWLLRDSATG